MDEGERQAYAQLVELVGWFFFNLFLLGYVEDPVTGHSFQFPGGMAWAVYVEVGGGGGGAPPVGWLGCTCVLLQGGVHVHTCINYMAVYGTFMDADTYIHVDTYTLYTCTCTCLSDRTTKILHCK